LIAALVDQGSGVQWGCYGSAAGTTIAEGGGAIYAGLANTNKIVAACGAGTAAQLCAAYTAGGINLAGFTNWYLPSHDELQIVCDQRALINLTIAPSYSGVGAFYWSSTEYNSAIGYGHYSLHGIYDYNYYKNVTFGASAAYLTFPNLTVNNAAGIVISKNSIVNGTMTLTNGLVNIRNNNFTFGPTAAVTGFPTATSMIIATSATGQVLKNWNGIGSFTFPVGDNTGTAEYSPVTLNFISGTIAGGITGVNLVNAPYADPSITGSYLNRFWNLTQTGITGFVCNAIYQYTLADVVGTEANISGLQVLPVPIKAFTGANIAADQLITNGLTSFGKINGGPGNNSLMLTAFLGGPFNGTNAMNTFLNNGNLIPLAQPYTNVAPWNYTGTESVTAVPAGVVDWVLVEVRQATSADLATSSTILTKRAGFLTSTGAIVDLDGVSPLNIGRISITDPLFVVIRHRNHLAIMSNNAVKKDANGIYNYDFTTALTQAYGAGLGYKALGTTFAMVAGDADQDGAIYVSDYSAWAANYSQTNGYFDFDIDMDGASYVSDYSEWAVNYGKDITLSPVMKSAKLNAAAVKSEVSKPQFTSSVPK